MIVFQLQSRGPAAERLSLALVAWGGSSPSQAPYLLDDGRDRLYLVEHRVGSRLHAGVEMCEAHGRAQHHNRDAGIRLAQLAYQLAPVPVGQAQVDHRHVEMSAKAPIKRLSG